MKLVLLQKETEVRVVEEPGLAEIRSGVVSILGSPGRKVRVERSDTEWMEAIWSSKIGIQLRYREGSDLCRDSNLYPKTQKVIRAFRSYARGFDGWKSMFSWVPKNKRYCLKYVLSRVCKRIEITPEAALLATGGVLLLSWCLYMVLKYSQLFLSESFKDFSFIAYPILFSGLILSGIVISINNLVFCFYGHELSYINPEFRIGEENANMGRHDFGVAIVFIIAGIALFVAHVFVSALP
jgi:hypothetical protein